MDRPLISIIVPVYNVEKYLPQCIDSILAQTYEKLEIILVNDGSTDNSGNICEAYAGRDARVKTVHKRNEGLAEARNTGIAEAGGEYCSFVDSDDCIAGDYIEYLYDILHENHAQISICGYQKVYKTGSGERPDENDRERAVRVCDSPQALSVLLYQRGVIASAWGRLFKRELFSEIRFPGGRWHEDVAVMYRLFDQAGTVVIGDRKKYYYFQRPGSIIHSAFDSRRMDYILFTQECIEYMQDRHPELEKAAISRHFSACFDLLARIGNEREDYTVEYGRLVHEIKKYRKTVLFDSNARPMNRMAALGTYISVTAIQKLCCIPRRL